MISRHGARWVAKEGILSNTFQPVPNGEPYVGNMTPIGENQTFLNGISLRYTYAKFLEGITEKQIFKSAKNIGRVIKTTENIVDGVLKNFRNYYGSLKDNHNSYPPLWKKANKDDLMKDYESWTEHINSMDTKERDEYFGKKYDDIVQTGEGTEHVLDEDAHKFCPNIQSKYKQKMEILNKEIFPVIERIKNAMKSVPAFVDAYKADGQAFDDLTMMQMFQVIDYCVTSRFSASKGLCPSSIINDINYLYNYKFYGIYSKEDMKVRAYSYAKSLVSTLENFQNSHGKFPYKLFIIGKSDVGIAPLYSLLNFVSNHKDYTKQLKTDQNLNLFTRPAFADSFVIEVYQKCSKFYVRVNRNNENMKICNQDNEGDCTLEGFINFVNDKILNLKDFNRACGVFDWPSLQ